MIVEPFFKHIRPSGMMKKAIPAADPPKSVNVQEAQLLPTEQNQKKHRKKHHIPNKLGWLMLVVGKIDLGNREYDN